MPVAPGRMPATPFSTGAARAEVAGGSLWSVESAFGRRRGMREVVSGDVAGSNANRTRIDHGGDPGAGCGDTGHGGGGVADCRGRRAGGGPAGKRWRAPAGRSRVAPGGGFGGAGVSDDATPMMAQYQEIKASHPGALLFYRMGDFYELFFDDAVAAAAALDIALTRRGLHLGRPIPMCGVPVHAAEGYLLTLIRKGFRVAVAEQMEDPAEARKRGYKAVVRREVVRLVTPGTLTEEALLEARRSNYLSAFAEVRGEGALAWADISTGEVRVAPCPAVRLAGELARISPREVLLADGGPPGLAALVDEAGAAATALDRGAFDSEGATRRLCALWSVGSLAAFGVEGRAEASALGALVAYVELTQRGRLPFLQAPQREAPGDVMAIDAATRRNLELTEALGGGRKGSLLSVVDRTVTAAGARLLARRLAAPLRDPAEIVARQEAVAWLVGHPDRRADLREALRRVPDIDRALARLALARGGPRDLGAIRAGLAGAGAVAGMLADGPPRLAEAAARMTGLAVLSDLLAQALAADLPLLARDGGLIAAGHDAALDAQRALRDDGRGAVAALQAELVAQTGIASLKVRHNGVLGYFVEVAATHGERLLAPPMNAVFFHRQTTAGLYRFTTATLSGLETRILNAAAEAQAIELAHFARLVTAVTEAAPRIAQAARALAEADLAAALAELAAAEDWVRPAVVAGRDFAVQGGRHPVVEAALRRSGGGSFVANGCDLTPEGNRAAIWLVTGPNMGGKSTFLRQNALIAVLAQAGSFVPARAARIGVVSALFSRVGAADDLARGRSTFMVEMVETAAILNQADGAALVILDEIGRGTATWDGLSIAWAVLEHLHAANRCRALFATHYHELTALAGKLPGLRNATLRVREWEGGVVFLHEVQDGAADRSYGVQVARLAGLPAAVIDRARVVLEALEKGDREGTGPKAAVDDLPLFRAAPVAPAPAPRRTSVVEAALRDIHPDDLSPKEALAALYALKDLLR